MPYKFSIIFPSRNEEFLKNTVEDALSNTGDDTELIVVLDGKWSDPPLLQHPRLNVIYVPEHIGQRSATNLGVKLSKAKFIGKADAHISFEKDFDTKMIEAFDKVGDNVVMTAIMRNLVAFNWKCPKCGMKVYQDVVPKCPTCGTAMRKKMIWKPRRGTHSTSFCFDSEPHFNYFNDYCQREKFIKDREETGLTESMSLQGSFFMMTREKYLELAEVRENLGSWGNEGVEIACSFWLSGGKVLVNHKTSYSHLFRTKNGVFGFPYDQPGSEVHKTKQRVKDLFWKKLYKHQIYPVSWLVEKFLPVADWTPKKLKEIK
jgi:glycosyltransferase involved in cell wall biosynthesis